MRHHLEVAVSDREQAERGELAAERDGPTAARRLGIAATATERPRQRGRSRAYSSRPAVGLVAARTVSSPPSPESATVTWRRAISETSNVGSIEASANGSSSAHTRRGSSVERVGPHDELVVVGAEVLRDRAARARARCSPLPRSRC